MKKQRESSLPLGWVLTTIREVLEETVEQEGPREGGEFTYIDISSIDNKTKKIVQPKKLPSFAAPTRARQRLQAQDVLVSLTRPNLNAVAIVPEGLTDAIGSTGFCVLRISEISPLWLYYLVQTDDFVKAMTDLVQGVVYPAIRPKDILSYEIPLAPLAEQQRIIEEIDEQFSRLEAGADSLQRLLSNLTHYRASVLKAACDGRLVSPEAVSAHTEGRDYEPAEILLTRVLHERRAKWEVEQLAKMEEQGKTPKNDRWKEQYVEPTPPETSELLVLPEGWVWASVDQLIAFEPHSLTDGPFGSNLKSSHYTEEGPRVIRLQNIGDGYFIDEYAHISEEHFETLKKHQIFAGDIVIASLSEVAPRACIIPPFVGPAIVKADCIRFKPHEELAAPEYLNYALNAEPTRKRTTAFIHGVGRPRLGLSGIRSIALPLPPLAEQQRIVVEVERRLSLIEELERMVQANLKRAGTLRQRILKHAFEGRLVLQNKTDDKADEPASVLLERIRLERERREAEQRTARKKGSKKMTKERPPEQTSRRDIVEVLRESRAPLTPEQLFREAGYTADEVEEFYAALKLADKDQAFTQKIHGNGEVYLAARA